jgi:hypothetical protein
MGINLTPAELLEVFGDFDPVRHQAEAEERWGDTDAYQESTRRTTAYGKDEWLRIRAEAQAVSRAFADAQAAGWAPDSEQARAAAQQHRDHIDRWFYTLTPEMHRGLAEMYVSDPRFAANYDSVAPGLAAYVRDAILALYP